MLKQATWSDNINPIFYCFSLKYVNTGGKDKTPAFSVEIGSGLCNQSRVPSISQLFIARGRLLQSLKNMFRPHIVTAYQEHKEH